MEPFEQATTRKDLALFAQFLREKIYTECEPLAVAAAVTEEPVPFAERETLSYRPVAEGERWSGRLFDCGWLHVTGRWQKKRPGLERVVLMDVSGEGCLFDGAGTPVRGLTNVASQFDRRYGLPGKRVLFESELGGDGEKLDFWVESGNNDLFGGDCGGRLNTCCTAYLNPEARALYYDFTFLLDFAEACGTCRPQHYAVLEALEAAASRVSSDCLPAEVAAARQALSKELGRRNGPDNVFTTFYAVGHAHLDLAWLWPLRETRRKAGRTFASAAANLAAYPKAVYGFSQPQQFEWLEKDYPALFKKVAALVASGRVEPQGGMWVEADCNIPAGESLARQFLYGKRYFAEKFNRSPRVCWLPDAFGFPGSLPQILKQCGMDGFLTIKLSWAEHSKFPHHTFRWRGIDGTEVLSHMPPEGTYNSEAAPRSLLAAERDFIERGRLDKAVLLYGIGDGGGGPGRDHLERLERAENFAGLPAVVNAPAQQYFDELKKDAARLPVFCGELYLDRHQGTLTSAAKAKWHNRQMERLLHRAEALGVLAWLAGAAYPASALSTIWKEVLLYQFHDILPGSAIRRVYDECVPRYEALEAETERLIEGSCRALGGGARGVFNPCSFARAEVVERGGVWYRVEAAPLAVTELTEAALPAGLSASADRLENECLAATFDENGRLCGLLDKRRNVQTLKSGNELTLYSEFADCWDMSAHFKRYECGGFRLVSASARVGGACAVREQVLKYGNSVLRQRILLKSGSDTLEFENELDWAENKKMLRVRFSPPAAFSEAVCGIQFGSIARPVYSDSAEDYGMYETAVHKWVDVTWGGAGLALLTDSKYGCCVKDGEVSLNLMRAQNYPCEGGETGRHVFRYALYPHAGGTYDSRVQLAAEAFDRPLVPVSCPATSPLVTLDTDGVVAESVKRAEDGSGVVVRLFEWRGRAERARLRLGFPCAAAFESDMLEEKLVPLELAGGCEAELCFRPFEIKTLVLKRDLS